MTQEDLAKLAGVGLSTIQSAEKGLAISLGNLIKVAAALGCKPQDLFITDEDRREVTDAHVRLMKKIMESFAANIK
jgi:transcriptional regulator with XRE-family HTH domain